MRVTLALAVFLTSTPALAQESGPPCGPRDDVLKQLGDNYNEAPAFAGIGKETLTEVLTSKDGETWTIIQSTRVDGQTISCLMSAGESWTAVDRIEPTAQGL